MKCLFDISFLVLEDLDKMFNSLRNGEGIDGIMEEIFIAVEFLKMNDKSKGTSIARFIGHNRAYGVAYRNGLFQEETSNCLSNVIKFRYNDVLKITSNYIKAVSVTYFSTFAIAFNRSIRSRSINMYYLYYRI